MSLYDTYQHITDGIIQALEAGTVPWRKPWTGGGTALGLPQRSTGEHYRGINVIWLWLMAYEKEYTSTQWFSYKQAAKQGGKVRKGEKATRVVFYGTLERKDDQGQDLTIPYAKTYPAFNADQIDGLPDDCYKRPDPIRDLGTKSNDALDQMLSNSGATILSSNQPKAYYSPSEDHIHLPPVQTFRSASGYYATLAHELVHWTGAKSRLDRVHDKKKENYAFEELIAEIGACMVCANLGLAPNFEQSGAYVESWLKCLKDDRKAIFKAAAEAQKACDFLMEKILPA